MANLIRGEIEADIGGSMRVLCLTLGALAELEAALGAGDLVALATRFESGRLSARDVLSIIACGLRGGGMSVSDADVAAMRIPGGVAASVRIAAALVNAAFGDGAEARKGAANPPLPQDY